MMQYLPSHGYELNSCSSLIRNLVYDHAGDLSVNMEPKVAETAEEKAAAACNRHSEAERRRRKRINGHLATLRSILPNTVKTDKASLLGDVVRRMRELKKMVAELESKAAMDEYCDDQMIQNNEYYMIPSENDQLELTYIGEEDSSSSSTNIKIMVKVRMCCQDRPDLIVDLKRALGLARGKLVRTEIGTLGGRIKCMLWVQISSLVTKEQGLHDLRRALKVVIDRATLLDLPRNKRPRLLDSV